jgi:hypothetical protein
VPARFVIHRLDELTEALARLGTVLGLEQRDCLVLESLHEALGLGLVIGIPRAAQADPDSLGLQQVGLGRRGILDATLRVVDQPRPNRARGQGHLERGQRQFRLQVALERPADAAATIGSHQDGQVHELLR